MARRRAQTAERAAGFAALWARMSASRGTTDLAVGDDREAREARREVDLLVPDNPGWELRPIDSDPRPPLGLIVAALIVAAAVPIAFALSGTAVTGRTGAGSAIGTNSTCTWEDGSTSPGTCLFEDGFSGSTLDSTKWLAEDDMVSALLEHAAPWGCVRHENVAVGGGNLQLTTSDNVRVSCPQTWTPSAYYTANFVSGPLGSFPAPTGTSYDTASVSQQTFNTTYGHYYIRAKMAGGTSPWSGLLMWGTNCQTGGAMKSLMEGIFTQTGPCNWPAAGSYEVDITSYVHAQADGKQGIFGLHRDTGNGAPFLRDFFSTPYYGWEAAPGGTGINPQYHFYITSVDFGDLSAAFHVYEFDWRPGQMTFLIDGQIATQFTAAYVPALPMFIQLWNVDNAAAAASLPQTMLVDYVRVACPPGVPCVWTP